MSTRVAAFSLAPTRLLRCARNDGKTAKPACRDGDTSPRRHQRQAERALGHLAMRGMVGAIGLGQRVREADKVLGRGFKVVAAAPQQPQDERRARRGDAAELRRDAPELVARPRQPFGIGEMRADIGVEEDRLLRLLAQLVEARERPAPEIGREPRRDAAEEPGRGGADRRPEILDERASHRARPENDAARGGVPSFEV
jgi:hypothetical protein